MRVRRRIGDEEEGEEMNIRISIQTDLGKWKDINFVTLHDGEMSVTTPSGTTDAEIFGAMNVLNEAAQIWLDDHAHIRREFGAAWRRASLRVVSDEDD